MSLRLRDVPLACFGLVLLACGGDESPPPRVPKPQPTTAAQGWGAAKTNESVGTSSDTRATFSAPGEKPKAPPTPAGSKAFRVPEFKMLQRVRQPKGTQWCWAAASEMVTRASEPEAYIKMCQHASVVFKKDCCTDRPGDCANPSYPNFGALDYRAEEATGKGWLSLDALKRELDQRYVAVTERYSPESAHMKVIFGYAAVKGLDFVVSYNPLTGSFGWHDWNIYREGDNGLFDPDVMYWDVRKASSSAASPAPTASTSAAPAPTASTPAVSRPLGKAAKAGAPPSGQTSPSTSPAQTAKTPAEAFALGFEIIKEIGSNYPEFAGLKSPTEAAKLEECPNGTREMEIFRLKQRFVVKGVNYCVAGELDARGTFWVGKTTPNSWAPYHFQQVEQPRLSDELRPKWGPTNTTLVLVPSIGRYVLKIKGTETYVSLEQFGTIAPLTVMTHEVLLQEAINLSPKLPQGPSKPKP